MQLRRTRNRVLGWTAWHTIGVYGSLRHAQGRISGKRAARSPRRLVAAAVAGLAVGLMAGLVIRSGFGGGCDHDDHHEHGEHPGHEHADDVASAPTGEQVAPGNSGVVTA
jgi:hypothetical protein